MLLERTRPLVERYEVVKDVRGLGLMWAIEFGEPDKGRTTWRLLEKMQPGLFAQLVVVPLFTDHRILSQVAGHGLNVIKGLPPLVVSEEDVDWFAAALDEVVGEAQKLGRGDRRASRCGRRAPVARSRHGSSPPAAPSGNSARAATSPARPQAATTATCSQSSQICSCAGARCRASAG